MIENFSTRGAPLGEHIWRRGRIASATARRLALAIWEDPDRVRSGVFSPADLRCAADLFDRVVHDPAASSVEIRGLAGAVAARVGPKGRWQVAQIEEVAVPPFPPAVALAIGLQQALDHPPRRGQAWDYGRRGLQFAFEAEERFARYAERARALAAELDARGAPPPIVRDWIRLVRENGQRVAPRPLDAGSADLASTGGAS